MDSYNEIQQNIAARKVNILKGFAEVQDIIEKGKVIDSTKPAGTNKPAIEKEEPKIDAESEFLGMKVDTEEEDENDK